MNKELNLLSSALNFGRRRLQWDIPNPVQSLRLKEPEGRIRWISREEADRLIAAAAPVRSYLPDFIVLGLNTGMRKGEMLGLTWDRVDLDQGMVYLTDQDQKNGKHGSIPLNDDAMKALENRKEFRAEYCPQSPWVFAKRNGDQVADIGYKERIQDCLREGWHQGLHPA